MTVPISDAATTKFKLRRATLVDDALARTCLGFAEGAEQKHEGL